LAASALLAVSSANGGCGTPSEAAAQRIPGVTAAIDPRTRQQLEAELEAEHAPASPITTLPEPLPATSGGEEPVYGVPIPLDGSEGALRSFYAGLRRAQIGEGQARIVVYGASHVAGDYATGTLRRLLQGRFGDAGHGFILPAHPWPHYRHNDVTIESNQRRWTAERIRAGSTDVGTYGLAGVSMNTSSAGAFGRVSTGAHNASAFELYFWRQPEGGTLEVRIDDQVVGRIRTRAPEPGPDYAMFHAPDAPHTFEVRAIGDGPVTLFGVSMEREVPGVVLDTLGINGARAANQLKWDEPLWREHLRRRAPDLVVLAYGTNESGDDDHPIEAYEAELREVIGRVHAAVPNASCMLVGPSDRPQVMRGNVFAERPRTSQIVETQRRVGRELGCAFFDLVAFGGGPMHMVDWVSLDPAWAQRDYVHFTIRGYLRLGEVLDEAILSDYPSWLSTADRSGPLAQR
jgi:lysophospholipase L1-like esterase